MKFKTIAEVKQANKQINNYFFDKATVKFFNSKIESKLINKDQKQYFITSEQFINVINGFIDKRYFTIREVKENGEVITASQFQEFKTIQEAKNVLSKIKKTIDNCIKIV